MVFSSTIFLFGFLPICLFGYYLINPKLRNIFLLVMSLGFYAWGEPSFVFVMISSIMVNWLFGLLVSRTRKQTIKRLIMILMCVFNISLFFVFKYLTFSISQINRFFDLSINGPNFLLPIGISFFTFQAMSYVIDVYRGEAEAQKNPLNAALYIALFPQLIAGPIVRYQTIANEITSRSFKLEDFFRGINRFIIGLAKKVIIANSMALVADYAFTGFEPSTATVLIVWLGLVCYALQIYFDFSGYSDMAIGLGLMFGFHFNENFNYPYISKSVTEFWRRWHISLGSWFRDYVYFPLGGSRVNSKARLVFNLFVVWTLTGVWHGASWNFAFWGLFYFALLTFEKLTGIIKRLDGHPVKTQVYRIATLLFVLIGWVFFRSEGMAKALVYLGVMFGGITAPLADANALYMISQNMIILIIAIVGCTPLLSRLYQRIVKHTSFWTLTRSSQAASLKTTGTNSFRPNRTTVVVQAIQQLALFGLFLISIAFMVSSTFNPFIYFNF